MLYPEGIGDQFVGTKHRKEKRQGSKKYMGRIDGTKRKTSSTCEAFASESDGTTDGICIDNESCMHPAESNLVLQVELAERAAL